MRVLLIDDVREVEGADFTARTFDEGMNQLINKGPWGMLLIDHDLGDFDDTGRERTGYDILCFLEQNPQYVPHKIVVVSDNPVGREKMNQVIRNIQKLMREMEKTHQELMKEEQNG